MRLHVCLEIGDLRKFPSALLHLALVRPLARMHAHVALQVEIEREGLGATGEGTSKWTRAAVHQMMTLQLRPVYERFATAGKQTNETACRHPYIAHMAEQNIQRHASCCV